MIVKRFLAACVVFAILTNVGPIRAQDDGLADKLADIVASGDSEAFRSINWHTNLVDAVSEAKRTKRGLFLWVMDGHPLGCT